MKIKERFLFVLGKAYAIPGTVEKFDHIPALGRPGIGLQMFISRPDVDDPSTIITLKVGELLRKGFLLNVE